MKNKTKDQFLSEENLDLRNMSEEEIQAYWDIWFRQAQATNDLDKYAYSHGVFALPGFLMKPHMEDITRSR